MGRGGLEPPTSRLSGVRSNHLSYRPKLILRCKIGVARQAICKANLPRGSDLKGNSHASRSAHVFPEEIWGRPGPFDIDRQRYRSVAKCIHEVRKRTFQLTRCILRKEVIQPQVPLRLPCYDFTPVADPTVARCLLKG